MLNEKRSSILFPLVVLLFSILIVTYSSAQTCIDGDLDGYGLNGDASCVNVGVDCNDNDLAINPGAVEGPFGDDTCSDGADNDCDGLIDEVDLLNCSDPDIDDDGDSFTENQGDCNDGNATVYPGAPLKCDGLDNNCDGSKDFSTDEDKDEDGEPWCAGDCDDNDPNRSHNILEGPFGDSKCSDGIDNDCDNRVDSIDSQCMIICADLDEDGYGNPGHPSCSNGSATDCKDNDINVNPGAADTNCNGVDDNCSGTADDGYLVTQTSCGIGSCAASGLLECQSGSEINTCVSGVPVVESPVGSPECGDGVDNDCDGTTDAGDPGCAACTDNDVDGFGSNGDITCANGTAIDCNDNDAAINPGASDSNCNLVDDNCTGTADDGYVVIPTNCGVGVCANIGLMECQTGIVTDSCVPLSAETEGPYLGPTCSDLIDNDCDGFTDGADIADCSSLDVDDDGDGYTENEGDCDDMHNTVYPNAPLRCDGLDNNCDGNKDFMTDEDKDGDGEPWCAGDCDDNDPTRTHIILEGPYGDAKCSDGIDNDCDNRVDIIDSQCRDICTDMDRDGYGNPGHRLCTKGSATDCNDNNAAINPGAADSNCNGVDDNCTGSADDGYIKTQTNCGIGSCAASGLLECQSGIEVDTCFPGTPIVESPIGSPQCGDGLDNDCDGFTDAVDKGCAPCTDNDEDGYGSNDDPTCQFVGVDCNDSDATINPGAVDSNCDGVDDNCTGTADDGYVVTPTNCGLGVCAASGQMECQGGIETDTCVPFEAGTEGPYPGPTCSDGLDNDCNGLTDVTDIYNCSDQDVDDDGDSFTENQGDCDDTEPQVFPGAPLVCDGKDNNCDGIKDFMTDEDKDGDGVPWCAKDCDDNDAARYPGNQEGPRGDVTCFDFIDNNCDNRLDIADSGCAPPSCNTKFTPRDGPHIFDLLDAVDDSVIASACSWCHTDVLMGAGTTDQRAECQRCHADPGDTSDSLNGILKDPINPNAYPGNPPYGFATALNVKLHSSKVVGTKYENWDMDCVTCHNPHQQEQDNINGTDYGQYIKEYICFDNSVTGLNIEEIVEFITAEGAGSFADGPTHNENVCEMCHTRTNHHRNDGSAPGDLDQQDNYVAHFDGDNCTQCHPHEEGFKPSCGACHDAPPPTGTHLKHFGGTKEDAGYGNTDVTEDFALQETVYLMNCGNCHPIDESQHMNSVMNSGNGSAEIELYNPNAPAGSLKALNPPSATYTPGQTVFIDDKGLSYTQGTCSNVYCHSVTDFSTTGQIPEPLPWVYPLQYDPQWEDFVVKTTLYKSPVWGVDSLGCDGCHGYPITTECKPDPITGGCTEVDAGAGDSHAWIDMFGEINLHAWNMKIYFSPLQCNTCHYNTVREDALWYKDEFSALFDDISIYNTSTHVNGTKDVIFTPIPVEYQKRFGPTYHDLSSSVFDSETKTCSNVSCHKSQTVVKWGTPYRWDNETECNVCHNY